MRILILGLVASAFAMPVSAELLTPEGGFQDARTAETFKAFEDICLPFALHKSELPLSQNIAHHQKMMTERGYGDGQIVQNPYKDFPVGARTITYSSSTTQSSKVQLIFKPLLQNQVAPYGGISCEITTHYDVNLEVNLARRLITQEPDWTISDFRNNINSYPNIEWLPASDGVSKTSHNHDFTKQKFTVFNGVEALEVEVDEELANLHICAYGNPDSAFVQLQIKNMQPLFIEPAQASYVLRLKASRSSCGSLAK